MKNELNKQLPTRRRWIKQTGLALTALAASNSIKLLAKGNSSLRRLSVLGLQSYSLKTLDLDDMLAVMKRLGLKSCELWEGHIQPRQFMWRKDATEAERKQNENGLKEWAAQLSMMEITAIKSKFVAAGITIQAYNGSFNAYNTDQELELPYKIAKTLGTKIITTSAPLNQLGRLKNIIPKYKMNLGMHNHSKVNDPNQIATPESFAKAMELSPFIGINLDIGHFTAANYDPVEFIRAHHKKIYCLHIRDRKKNQGAVMPFGEGDTPIKAVFELLKSNRWNIPCNIEYDYTATDPETEVKRCIEYCKPLL